jgi:hypothetical protein
MAEVRGTLPGSAFEFFEQVFDSIPISMCDVLKSEVLLEERGLEPWCAVDEKQTLGDIMFLQEFPSR